MRGTTLLVIDPLATTGMQLIEMHRFTRPREAWHANTAVALAAAGRASIAFGMIGTLLEFGDKKQNGEHWCDPKSPGTPHERG
jgi:hypothetical protein